MIEQSILTFLQQAISLTPGVDLFLDSFPLECSTGVVLKLLNVSDNLTPLNYASIIIIVSYREYWKTRNKAEAIKEALKTSTGYTGTWAISGAVNLTNYGKEENGFYHTAITGTVIYE